MNAKGGKPPKRPPQAGQSNPNSVDMLAQVGDEDKLKTHIKFVREKAAKMDMRLEIHKPTSDGR